MNVTCYSPYHKDPQSATPGHQGKGYTRKRKSTRHQPSTSYYILLGGFRKAGAVHSRKTQHNKLNIFAEKNISLRRKNIV